MLQITLVFGGVDVNGDCNIVIEYDDNRRQEELGIYL